MSRGVICPKCNQRMYVDSGFSDGDALECLNCRVTFYIAIEVTATYDGEYEEEGE